jgi:hypothetical protein
MHPPALVPNQSQEFKRGASTRTKRGNQDIRVDYEFKQLHDSTRFSFGTRAYFSPGPVIQCVHFEYAGVENGDGQKAQFPA